jgi:hypothetical protein
MGIASRQVVRIRCASASSQSWITRGLALRAVGHRGLEAGRAVGVGGEVLEEALAVDVLEGRPALGRCAQQPRGRQPVQLAARHGGSAQRAGDAVAQTLPEGGEGEAPVVVLGEDVVEHEPAQHAHEQVGVGAHRVGDLTTRPRSVRQDVGHAELGGDVEQLGRQVPVDQLRERSRWAAAASAATSLVVARPACTA